MASSRYNAITCTAWVPQGIAQENPLKVRITKDQLAKLFKQTSKKVRNLKEANDVDHSTIEENDSRKIKKSKKSKNQEKQKDVQIKDEEVESESAKQNDQISDDILEEYKFEEYDDDEEENDDISKFAKFVEHPDNEADHYISKEESDDESEKANSKIEPTDNLIVVGHVEESASTLEIYVYNSEEESLYVHHDILLPSIPLCLEWLNYNPTDETLKPGNMIAIGSMESSIEVWDLDVVNVLEPAYVLGGQTKKKKSKKLKPSSGHRDAVLCLAWNSHFDHILASGSADQCVILWDLEKTQEAQRMSEFHGRIQNIKWQPDDNDRLIAGCTSGEVNLFECSSNSKCMSWKLDGEVESLCWNTNHGLSFNFFAGTELGSVYSMDVRHSKPLYKFKAHNKPCTGMVINSSCPGCFVTVSEDETVKIWDVKKDEALLVEEMHPDLGVVHDVSCSPDSPFVLCLGGNNCKNNFKVWDIRNSSKVREMFHDRLDCPIEDERKLSSTSSKNIRPSSEDEESFASSEAYSCKPPKKSKKRKGSHRERKIK